jgi:uncharacterized protein YukE
METGADWSEFRWSALRGSATIFPMLPADGIGAGLFLSPVPVPKGDPGALSRAATTYASAHGEIDRNRAVLAAVGSEASGQTWTGAGAAAYVSASARLAAAYTMTASALARGAATLRTYASELTAAQRITHQANTAVEVANATTSAFLAAQASYEQSAATADQASDAAATAHAQAAVNPHSPAARIAADTAQSAAEQAQSAELGYGQRVPPQKLPFNSHGQPAFWNGKVYISPDADGHNVWGWKMFSRSGDRIGTYNWDLSTRVKG